MKTSFFVSSAVLLALSSILISPAMNGNPQHGVRAPSIIEPVPAYHSNPTSKLPKLLAADHFRADPLVKNAYAAAARMKATLYQLPCYCYCDRSEGHASLLDCYVGEHAAICDTCRREVFYAYAQQKKGKGVKTIRRGILCGAWREVRLSDWESETAIGGTEAIASGLRVNAKAVHANR